MKHRKNKNACAKIERDHSKYNCVNLCPSDVFSSKSRHSSLEEDLDLCRPLGDLARGESGWDEMEWVELPTWRRNSLRCRSNLILPKCGHMGSTLHNGEWVGWVGLFKDGAPGAPVCSQFGKEFPANNCQKQKNWNGGAGGS